MDAEIKRIINGVFEATGVKLEPNDPLVAVLLLQYSFFNDAVNKLRTEQLEMNTGFINQFNDKADALMIAVNRLEENRKAMLLELLHKNDEAISQVEDRVYARISPRLDSQIQEPERLLYAIGKWFVVTILILVCVLTFFLK